MNLRDYYTKLWKKERIDRTNECFEHYLARSMSIPALIIDGVAHLVFIFPGKDEDYHIKFTGIISNVRGQ